MKEKRKEERFKIEPPSLISSEFKTGKGAEKEKLWRLNVVNCSRYGLGLLVTKVNSELLVILKPGDTIKDMMLYAEWAVMKVDAKVRHLAKVKQGSYKGMYILGVESSEIIEVCKRRKKFDDMR